MTTKPDSKTATRRKFLLAAGATTAAATLAAPAVQAQQGPISMRFQSTWPSKDIFHEYAVRRSVQARPGGVCRRAAVGTDRVPP